MDNTFKSGIIPDPRSEVEKALDYQHEEFSAGVPLNWKRDKSGAPVYSLRDQNGSGSCVGQACAKAIETDKKEVISAHPIYRRRANFPSEGMWLQNAGDIVKKLGTTTEVLDPSQKMTEEQMNADVAVDTPITEPMYVMANVQNIDQIAEAIELYKECPITLGFDLAEYENSEKPIDNGKPANAYHCICGIYYFTDENGEKCILADESWGPNFIKQRILTESYLKSRGTGAMYFVPVGDGPHYVFKNQLSFGMINNVDVRFLQDVLKFEGFLLQSIPSTGNYLQLTAKAVLAWQLSHQIDTPAVLNGLAGKHIGPKSLAKLNELYSA